MTAKTQGAFGSIVRWTTLSLAAAALLTLAACDGPPAPETSAPQPTAGPDAPNSTPLLGAPPAPTDQSAEPPPAPAPFDFQPMQPVPNPEDLSGDARVKIYGHRYDHLGAPALHGRHHHHPGGRAHGPIGASPPAAHPPAPVHHAHHAHPAAQPAASKPAAPHAAAPAHHKQAPTPNPTPAPKPAPAPAVSAQPAAPARSAAPASSAAQPAVSSADQDQGGPTASGASSAQAASAADNAAPNRLNADWLTIPGLPTVDVPGFGKVPSKTLLAIGLLLLALVILALAVLGVPAKGKAKPAAKPSDYRPTELGGADPPKPPEA